MAFQHKKESGMVGVKGHCKECDLTWEGGGTQLQATRHFQNTGHVIHVEQTIWWEWLPVIAAYGKPKHKATKKKAIRRNRKSNIDLIVLLCSRIAKTPLPFLILSYLAVV